MDLCGLVCGGVCLLHVVDEQCQSGVGVRVGITVRWCTIAGRERKLWACMAFCVGIGETVWARSEKSTPRSSGGNGVGAWWEKMVVCVELGFTADTPVNNIYG